MKTHLTTLLLLSALSCTPLAAGKDRPAPSGDPYARIPSDLKVIKDVVYKQVGDAKLDMMVILPSEKKFEKSPLVVFIHGGGWGAGDKFHIGRHDAVGVARGLTQQGVTVACIEYRLANGGASTSYDSAADCKDAARFLTNHAAEYGIDPNRVGTWGESAGGNLTLVTALGVEQDYPCDKSIGGTPVKFRCVAAFYPLVSFVDPAMAKGSNFERPERVLPILGGLVDEKRDIAKKLSPLELLKSDSPAIFLAHGDADKTLSVVNSITMRDAAIAKGVPVECIICKGAGHGFSGDNIDPTVEEIDRRTVEFLLKYLTAP